MSVVDLVAQWLVPAMCGGFVTALAIAWKWERAIVSGLKATSDSLSAGISSAANTASGALNKATSLDANLTGFKTTVAQTYATNSMVQELSTTVSQTKSDLTVSIKKAQDTADGAKGTANTAQSNASNAQQRAGVLETMIRMDSKGVRVGKTSNGTYTGPSVLVNSQGTVDIISSSDALLTRFQRYGFTVPFDTGAATIVASGGGFSINVAQNDGTKYAINLGAGGIGISAPDGTHVDCSSDTGALIETTKFGRLLIGTESLELTRGDATGLSMSNAGFSLKWAGGHQLATGPIAGALYIDGREILHV